MLACRRIRLLGPFRVTRRLAGYRDCGVAGAREELHYVCGGLHSRFGRCMRSIAVAQIGSGEEQGEAMGESYIWEHLLRFCGYIYTIQ